MRQSLLVLLFPLILTFNVEAQSDADLNDIIDRCERLYSSSNERLDCMRQALDNPGQSQELEPAQEQQESRKDASDCASLQMTSARPKIVNRCAGNVIVSLVDGGSCSGGCTGTLEANSEMPLERRPMGFVQFAACNSPYQVNWLPNKSYECN